MQNSQSTSFIRHGNVSYYISPSSLNSKAAYHAYFTIGTVAITCMR